MQEYLARRAALSAAAQPPLPSFDEVAREAQEWQELISANSGWRRKRLSGEQYARVDREGYTRAWINEVVRFSSRFQLLFQEMLEGDCVEEWQPLEEEE